MSILDIPRTRWRGWIPSRRTLTILTVVLGLLLAEWQLPWLLSRFGSDLFLLVLIGLPAVLVVARRPYLGLLALVCYAPFAAYLRFGGLSNVQSLFKDIVALGLVGLWLVRTIVQRRKLVRTPLDIPLLLFMVLAALSALRGPTLLRGALELKILAVYIPIYFLIANEPPSKKQLRLLLWALLIIGAVSSIYGLYQQAVFSNAPPTQQYTLEVEGQTLVVARRFEQVRTFSTFADSGVFSLFLVMSIMLALGLQYGTSSRGERIALWAIILLMVANLPATLTRMGWIGLLIGWVVHTLLSPLAGRRRWLLLSLPVVVGLLLTIGGSTMQRVLNWSFSEEDTSYQTRRDMIPWAYRMIFVERIEGCGLGSQPDAAEAASRVTRTYQPLFTCFWNGSAINGADTVALSIGVQMGLPGFLNYVAIFAILFWAGLRTYRRLTDPLLRGTATGILAYLAVMTVGNFFAGSTQAYPVVDLYFWFFVGILMSLERIQQASAEERNEDTPGQR
jgi:hypothetical protein